MKLVSRLLIAATLLTTGSLALAAPDRDDHGRHDRGRQGHDQRHDDRRSHGNDHRRYGYRDGGPRYRGHPHWQRGHRYNGPTYVVRNYGSYRLRPPPRGYHWVRANNDFLLVAVATGIILDVALH
ncbi:RcnB family protein [Rhodanobacter umsongensis]